MQLCVLLVEYNQETPLKHLCTIIETIARLITMDFFSVHLCLLPGILLLREYVLKMVSLGSKDCTKKLKLEYAYFLGQTS